MIVTPDCVDAEPVRERLRAAGYEQRDDTMGFGGTGEVWIRQSPFDVQSFVYCRDDRDKFLAQSVMEAAI